MLAFSTNFTRDHICSQTITIRVMFFLLNYREYYDNLCDEPELSPCNRDQEMSEIDVDITPETVDDDS